MTFLLTGLFGATVPVPYGLRGMSDMTSGPGDWKAFGAVRVLALRDAVVDYPWPLAELFPGVADDAWEQFRERFPTAFGGPHVWRSSYRCYLVRSEDRTVLVDTGMGPAGSPLSETLGLAGGLMGALEAAGTRPDDIDVVVLTHLHPDHVGGNLRGDALAFPRARYIVPQADWTHFHLPEVQAHFPFAFVEQTITPLERLGALELITGEHAVTGELTVIPTPGHTPGHSSLRIESGGVRALLIADALLHPAQVTEPDWISMFDVDPEQERRTRRALLDQLESERLVFSASHFPEPVFGRVDRVPEDGRRYWQPLR
jgi:glyoxylase-like metal-dependent hydrolase (beta-lactamase superfamily II)